MTSGDGNSDLSLDDVTIPGIEEYPETESVLLHGPPGTGKTTTSAARVGLLLRDHGYGIGDVTWATYRRSLADDTLDRLAAWDLIDDAELDEPKEGATRYISTIHAIANRVVGGLPSPIDTWHRPDFCKKQNIRFGTSKPWETSSGKELFKAFDWLAENCCDPTDPADLAAYPYLDKLSTEFPGDVGPMWDAWERYKDARDVIDFHEQLEAVLKRQVCPDTPILVIDEYHDATPLIARVAEMWMDEAEIVIVAGDPHQVVNSYQGASPHFFERLESHYPTVLLDKSYRLGDRTWAAGTSLLSRAHDPPTVETTLPTGEIIEYRSGAFEWSDARDKWLTPDPTAPESPAGVIENYGRGHDGDVMFLARTRKQADAIGAALEQSGIPYTSQGELGGWNTDRGETRLHLHNALRGIEDRQPSDFDQRAITAGLGHFSAAGGRNPPEVTTLSAEETAALLEHTNSRYLDQSRSDTKRLITGIVGRGQPQTHREINDLVTPEFWSVYTHGAASESELNKGGRSDRERRALQKALTTTDAPIDPADIGPSVMTIHASKGQEARDVVIYEGITDTIARAMRTHESARKNEWRCWYVAVTRASERVHMMYDGFRWTSSIIRPGTLTTAARDTTPDADADQEPTAASNGGVDR